MWHHPVQPVEQQEGEGEGQEGAGADEGGVLGDEIRLERVHRVGRVLPRRARPPTRSSQRRRRGSASEGFLPDPVVLRPSQNAEDGGGGSSLRPPRSRRNPRCPAAETDEENESSDPCHQTEPLRQISFFSSKLHCKLYSEFKLQFMATRAHS